MPEDLERSVWRISDRSALAWGEGAEAALTQISH